MFGHNLNQLLPKLVKHLVIIQVLSHQRNTDAIEMLLNWPLDKIFPALDFIRLMALHPEAANHWIRSNFFV